MCGGGPPEQYDAYRAGDFGRWQSAFERKADIEERLARGEITQQQANQQLNAITRGTPGRMETTVQYDPSGPNAFRGEQENAFRGESPTQYKTVQRMVGGTPGVNFDELANKIKSDASANMELREIMRQHDVNLGRIGIDQAFDRFGDDYYNQYKQDYTGYYNPQLDEQYGKVVDKTTAALAGRGMLESSVGANTYADLAKQQAEARTNIANEATDASNKLRGTVENAKSNLYSLNEASADPQAVNAQAVGQATALVAPPQYSPLGEVFASALNSLANYSSARANRPRREYESPYTTASGFGSGRVVN